MRRGRLVISRELSLTRTGTRTRVPRPGARSSFLSPGMQIRRHGATVSACSRLCSDTRETWTVP